MGNLMGNWYSLDCKYYTRQFPTLDELLNDILASGQDPNYGILKMVVPQCSQQRRHWVCKGLFVYSSK